jgi:hypothetical protein
MYKLLLKSFLSFTLLTLLSLNSWANGEIMDKEQATEYCDDVAYEKSGNGVDWDVVFDKCMKDRGFETQNDEESDS